MYESFFNLQTKPFSLLPDPGFIYLSPVHQEALTILEYGLMNQSGFIVLTGEIGVGKTTVMHCLLEQLDDSFAIGLISNTHQALGDWMAWVCSSFGIRPEDHTKVGLHEAFVDFVIGQYAQGKRTLLIIDEAQNLDSGSLEQLRLLSNINSSQDFVLQLMLLGQPQLRDLLRQPDMRQFVQRVAASYHLGSLDAADTEHYIRHRVAVAGGQEPIFTSDACDAVFGYSKGVPRLINLICDTALVYAYAAGSPSVTAEIVDEFVEAQAAHLLIPFERTKEPRAPRPKKMEPDQPDGQLLPDGILKSHGAVPAVSPEPIPGGTPPRPALVLHAGTAPDTDEAAAGEDGLGVEPLARRMGSESTTSTSPLDAVPVSRFAFGAGSGGSGGRTENDKQHRLKSDSSDRRSVPGASQVIRAFGAPPSTAGMPVGGESGEVPPLTEAAGGLSQPVIDAVKALDDAARRGQRLWWRKLAVGSLILNALAVGLLWYGRPDAWGVFRSLFDQGTPAESVELPEQEARYPRPEPSTDLSVTDEVAAPDGSLGDGSVSAASHRADEERSAVLNVPARTGEPIDSTVNSADHDAPAVEVEEGPLVRSGAAAAAASKATGSPSNAADPGVITGSGVSSPNSVGAESDATPLPSSATESRGFSETPPDDPTVGDLPLRLLEADLRAATIFVQRTDANRLVADLGDRVQFADGSVRLDADSKIFLRRLANDLRQSLPLQVRVIGHTDHQGRADVNLRLSERRAETVAQFLESSGIPADDLSYEGKGESEPKVELAQELQMGPSANRRIVLELVRPLAAQDDVGE